MRTNFLLRRFYRQSSGSALGRLRQSEAPTPGGAPLRPSRSFFNVTLGEMGAQAKVFFCVSLLL
jgi:hypothetical protein